MKYLLLNLTILILVSLSTVTNASEKLKIRRLTSPVYFDGRPDETAWKLTDTLSLTMNMPRFRGSSEERTWIKITYDDQYLWLGAKLWVNDPKDIKASSKKRDEMSGNSDYFGVVLDSYNDNENALGFFTTPTGLRMDAAISDDAASRNPLNLDWNTFWDVKTTRDDKGWYCEMRIPFSSLRFQTVSNITEMGMITWRYSASRAEVMSYPEIDPKHGTWGIWKPSLAKKIVLEGIKPAKPVYVSPYVIGGHLNDNSLNEAETDYVNEKLFKRDIGGDVKYSITSNLTMDLSLNTDFAQVEADDQMVNLTRFSLYFPEKRMFFQERASIFSFNLGGPSNLFYSRRIGLDEDGKQVRIYGGARLYGRMGKWDLGFLNMQTEKSTNLPSENFGVLRMRRQVINANSFIGGIFTSRLGAGGNYNAAYGIDGIFRLFGDDYLELKLAQTVENGVDFKAASLNPTRIRAKWERRSEKGLGYNFSFSHSGESFNPGVGFQSRDNFRSFRNSVQWGWIPGESSPLFSHNVNLRSYNYFVATTGKMQSGSFGPAWEFQTKKSLMGSFELKRMVEDIEEDFELSDDAKVPVGKYEFYGFEAAMQTPMNKKIFAEITLEAGQFYDGNRFSLMTTPFFNINSSVVISGTYQFDAVNFSKRKQEFENHIARLKLEYMHSTKLSASSFVQYNTLNAALLGNFRLRYNPREGNDFYIVFNEFRNLKPDLETPRLPELANRSILLKYTHTFIL